MKKLLLLVTLLIGTQFTYGQSKFFKSLRLDANLDISNKKRSYGVYNGEKYAKTGGFAGLDFGIYYQTKYFDYGVEYFTAYNHFNASFGYRDFILHEDNKNFIIRFIPDLKLGYSTVLEKVYYGFGASLNISWISISYSKLFHVKSGSSKYHGDGLNVISIGISLSKERIKKIFKAKSYKNSTNSFFFYD